ncbi:class A beta-lactamase-related serine hydrolase [Amycolatopsis cynarae]|uniref:Class A beta-lactamase-related serine hydrolase n=1 Tax=Amycolatopsis cynarae TaxID=2995223 RepID=A0ABY7B3W5_9PSEU|nr:serine hydrolase [Amycolatopsis sp. HUAS 11-8]WAL67009.1 class A beta-lactamase-related serine hydrolase [Amycolatopsis sp. HUAS 11-8]
MRELFAAAGVRGWVHARCLACDGEAGLAPDEPVVLASVVKVPLVLEFARQVAAGQLDPADRVRATAADRLGGTGSAGCLDDVEYSLRDAAFLALTVSDNTAADLLFERVGVDNVRLLLHELGLTATRITGPPRHIVQTMAEDIGAREAAEFARRFPGLTAAQVLATRALDPLRTTASTARDMTALLALVARGLAGPPEACRWLRELMGQQVNWHRLAAAFPPEVAVWGKTGSLPAIRNEIGVVEHPAGTCYAVAVFTRAEVLASRQPALDHVIGEAAREAIGRIPHECP